MAACSPRSAYAARYAGHARPFTLTAGPWPASGPFGTPPTLSWPGLAAVPNGGGRAVPDGRPAPAQELRFSFLPGGPERPSHQWAGTFESSAGRHVRVVGEPERHSLHLLSSYVKI